MLFCVNCSRMPSENDIDMNVLQFEGYAGSVSDGLWRVIVLGKMR